jgi:putative DNA primase/helicase
MIGRVQRKARKPTSIGFAAAAIPGELTTEKRWGVWRYEQRANGGYSKPPYRAESIGELANMNDPAHWGPFRVARQRVETRLADGVNFNLVNSSFGAVDLDHCRDGANVDDWAMNILDQAAVAGAYIEVTPSGEGFRILGRVTGTVTLERSFSVPGGANGAKVELFRRRKVVTVTGARYGAAVKTLPDIGGLLDNLLAQCEAQKTAAPAPPSTGERNDYSAEDYEKFAREGAPEGKNRSDTFHSVVWSYAALGLGLEDIVARLADNPDGIAERYIREDRLEREVKRSFDKWHRENPGASASAPEDRLDIVVASTIKAKAIRWLWPNRFALGKLGVLGGLPERGKGLITADMIARVTNGDEWPCGEGVAPQGNVILFTAEDTLDDTVIPRLKAAGADMDRVHIVRGIIRKEGTERTFSLIEDLARLELAIERIGDVVLVVIDPMSAYFGVGKLDTYRTSDVRGVITPMSKLAEKWRLSILGVMHFNKKETMTNAMLRMSDSLAFVAAPRHAYVVVNDPESEDGRKLFAKAKNNLAADHDQPTLAYITHKTREIGYDDEVNERIPAPYVEWLGPVQMTADEALAQESGSKESSAAKLEAAREFLREYLSGGEWKLSNLVFDDGMKAGHAHRTIERALGTIPVIKGREPGWHGRVRWKLQVAE